MQTLADRFRRWYDYERDCNSKTFEMLDSVPAERRETAEYRKAVDRMAHLTSARRRWLFRFGRLPEMPPLFPTGAKLDEVRATTADTESLWVEYLRTLDDAELARTIEWQGPDGTPFRFDVEGALTQVFGHAWYHRGQIAQLVAMLGGTAVDTDYILWCRRQNSDPSP